MRLQLSSNARARTSRHTRKLILATVSRLPELPGPAISLRFRPELTTYRGKLLSGCPERGVAVHAAAFIRKRQIVLEDALLADTNRLSAILAHEVFHFVWPRLGNGARRQFESVLNAEFEAGARGELGESAAVKKEALQLTGREKRKGRLWREYVCESFCDTGAWVYARQDQRAGWKLAKRWQIARTAWFAATFSEPRAC